jgi:hypothetical protein
MARWPRVVRNRYRASRCAVMASYAGERARGHEVFAQGHGPSRAEVGLPAGWRADSDTSSSSDPSHRAQDGEGEHRCRWHVLGPRLWARPPRQRAPTAGDVTVAGQADVTLVECSSRVRRLRSRSAWQRRTLLSCGPAACDGAGALSGDRDRSEDGPRSHGPAPRQGGSWRNPGASAVRSLPAPGSPELAKPTSAVLAVRPRRLLPRCAPSFLALPRTWEAPHPASVRTPYGVAILAAQQNQHAADHGHQQDHKILQRFTMRGLAGDDRWS